jgi:Protein of unknown function (DUF2752)
MVPSSWTETERLAARRLTFWVRSALVAVGAGLVVVFALAAWINPYDAQGRPLRMEAHRQLGLPACNFYRWTGQPCPACGMTTSFALLVHGDPANSLKANAVGTLLALAGLAALPWCFASAGRGRWVGVEVTEARVLGALTFLVVLALVRWVIVLGLRWRGILP